MGDESKEFNNQVNIGSKGERFAAISTTNGKIRINMDAAKKEVEVCLVDGSLKGDCLTKITYASDRPSATIPFIRVDGGTFIDIAGDIPKLNNLVTQALSLDRVETTKAEEIGRMVADIQYTKQRQVGSPLR